MMGCGCGMKNLVNGFLRLHPPIMPLRLSLQLSLQLPPQRSLQMLIQMTHIAKVVENWCTRVGKSVLLVGFL